MNLKLLCAGLNGIQRHAGRFLAAAVFALLLNPIFSRADPASLSGSGNFTVGGKDQTQLAQYAALRSTGAEAIRIDVYPYNYYDGKRPLPEKMDKQMLEAHQEGVRKIVLLFEYSGSFQRASGIPNHFGDYNKWHSLGHDYAERFAPNSQWLKSQGISDWGITIFEAFNEPDNNNPTNAIPLTGPSSYYTSLKGLADGVHSVAPALAVIPGGFMAENARHDHTLGGYGVALAPLWNDGTLDGIDLHTYNDIKYAPIVGKDGVARVNFLPQAGFDAVKKACHITRDINFYSTEYNFKSDTEGIDEPLAAKRLLTCIWANLGVVKNDGKTPATQLALVWNLFLTAQGDHFDGGLYGMATAENPWSPTDRAKTLQLVLSLTKGMEFTSLDPKGLGEFILEGSGKKMWVSQTYQRQRDAEPSLTGLSLTLDGIPSSAKKLDVYGWNGLQESIPLSGQISYKVTGLKSDETFMFLASCSN